MQAMVYERPGNPLVLRTVPRPEPGPAELLIEILACGVCRTDLHLVDGELPHPKVPVIPGHEIVGRVVAHPFVIGELACGTIPRRSSTLPLLEALPVVLTARHDEVMMLIERHGIAGTGLGWVDAHLLASATLTGTPLWTLDRALRRAAERLDVFGEPGA